MMTYIMFILSVMFVISFVGVSSKPSPIYGGVGLIVGGSVGCGIIVGFGGPFLGLMVFLVYLGGMLVVFGYTTAMAIEQYPEVLISNKTVLGAFVVGVLMESMLVFNVVKNMELELVVKFDGLGDWVVYDTGNTGVFNKEAVGASGLYNYGTWLVIVTGWTLLVAVVVIMEITRGN
uniref:NADH-ubiquinone oxidoreductase chain 6 n=1 Tax=Furipterus horrens TaxID=148082 RepID=A0A6M2RIY1_FURHO|nr:NADH dehydrogenase subunit 6 [Furipterus horrens]QCI56393.1 NADH dehydrogenase subunit 6 [Furipterus horrens]